MCGIAGAVGAVSPDIAEAVRRMDESQQHRGPDGLGFWSSADSSAEIQGVMLAHRRLSIIDLSDAASQPMTDPGTGNVLVFNGEIYNYREIREQLSSQHQVSFRTASDTEVILRSYAVWGISCVKHFRGMFAFGLFDRAKNQLHLVRDRLGIKPLYWTKVDRGSAGRTILFASELRAVLDSELVPRRLNPDAVADYLWNGFVFGPSTMVDGVSLLDAGNALEINVDTLAISQSVYWTLPSVNQETQDDTDEVRSQLDEAVRLRLISDVPLGVFLSGGVDSSAISAIAAAASSSPVHTFNVAFDESRYDESEYARAISKAIGSEHTELVLSEERFRDQLDDAMNCLDQPSFDALNTYFVSRAVREAGVTVALAGTGGDELFGGYSSFRDLPRAVRWGKRLSYIPRFLRGAGLGLCEAWMNRGAEIPRQTRWGKVRDIIDAGGDLVKSYQVAYGLFTRSFLRQLSGDSPGVNNWGRGTAGTDDEIQNGAEATLAAISRLELQSFIGQRLLRDTDCASMAVSLEVRVPLLDHQLVESVSQVSGDVRYQPLSRKMLLRRLALNGIDPAVFDRPKSGFVMPFDVWMKNSLSDRIDGLFGTDGLAESAGVNPESLARLYRGFQSGSPGIYWSRLWALYGLLWWVQKYRASLQ